MTYGDDRTAGAMSDDERRDYVRQNGAAMAVPPDGPSRDLLLREILGEIIYGGWTWEDNDFPDELIDVLTTGITRDLARSGHVIVRERAIGDALSDAIMEATNHGWNDPDSAIWRRGMAAACVVWCAAVVGSETEREMERWEWTQ